jgi:hypothetical protein
VARDGRPRDIPASPTLIHPTMIELILSKRAIDHPREQPIELINQRLTVGSKRRPEPLYLRTGRSCLSGRSSRATHGPQATDAGTLPRSFTGMTAENPARASLLTRAMSHHRSSKLVMRVRFPSPAPTRNPRSVACRGPLLSKPAGLSGSACPLRACEPGRTGATAGYLRSPESAGQRASRRGAVHLPSWS